MSLSQQLLQGTPTDSESYATYRDSCSQRFFFDADDRAVVNSVLVDIGSSLDSHARRVADLEAGFLTFFRHHRWNAGWPPRWHKNALDGAELEQHVHFSRIGDFAAGDIKIPWELNRFGFAYDLARAYWRTGEERSAELFWLAFEDWCEHNPPNAGANWKCGQEIGVRIMAWCFALWAFRDSPHTTPNRVAQMTLAIGASAIRIETHIDYAISQKNNHGVTEAAALWTVGLLFPEFTGSARWKERGAELLDRLSQELILDDGGFSQYSANYQRLMLQTYLWALRLGDLNSQPLSPNVARRVATSAAVLSTLVDESNGRVPRFGPDDGSLVIPLNDCAYSDYRPIITLLHFYDASVRCYDDGPWNEDLVWLFGVSALESEVAKPSFTDATAEQARTHILRGKSCNAVFRCGRFQFRPTDLDSLHVDLWWKGFNVAVDPGTYSYNAKPPWNNNPLRSARYHNTVTVDGLDHADLVGRFMAVPWPDDELIGREGDGQSDWAAVVGECRLPRAGGGSATVRRHLVRILDHNWLVIDNIELLPSGTARLHWLFQDCPHKLDLARQSMQLALPGGVFNVQWGVLKGTPQESDLVRARDNDLRGWESPAYWLLRPALSLAQVAEGDRVSFFSWLSPQMAELEPEDSRLVVMLEGGRFEVDLDSRTGHANYSLVPTR